MVLRAQSTLQLGEATFHFNQTSHTEVAGLVECVAAMQTSNTFETNRSLWAGAGFLLLFLLSSVLPFTEVPGKQALIWLNLVLGVLTLVFFVIGLRRAVGQPRRYRGKVAGWIFTVLSSFLLALAIFGFYAARSLPSAKAAPKVGEKAPEFELKDTSGQSLSLANLLAGAIDPSGTSMKPKAVLLVFYRGYW